MELDILKKFSETRILVVGDVMLDRYWWGDAVKISPEAPVPVVHLKDTSIAIGGAANVAANLRGLGSSVSIVGAIGDDAEGLLLKEQIAALGIGTEHLLSIPGRPTIVKTRVIAHEQQVVRIDQEDPTPIPHPDEESLLASLDAIGDIDAIVVSDYAKGLLTDRFLFSLMEIGKAKAIPVLVDPKGKRYAKYRGATILTPNKHEAAEACGISESDPDFLTAAGSEILASIGCGAVLITRGNEGMTLFNEDGETHFPTTARRVFDVTGAGDTVIATLAAGIASQIAIADSVHLANIAAGIVVESVGTTSIRINDLVNAISGE
jgi:D-beta-D-heptose 7-phosphate kinase/D-beta-D-heptose 1-phosphate adenosyltransferase